MDLESLAWSAFRNLDFSTTQWLEAKGIGPGFVARVSDPSGRLPVPMLGRMIAETDGRFWWSDPDLGRPVLTIAACNADRIEDVLAIELHNPAKILAITGTDLIGREAVERADHFKEPVKVFSDALAWLRAGAGDVLMIDMAHAPIALGGLVAVHAADAVTAEKLRRSFETAKTLQLPRLFAPISTGRAA